MVVPHLRIDSYVLPPRPPLPLLTVRLACVKHAASVRSEPGSNSQVHPVQNTKPANYLVVSLQTKRKPKLTYSRRTKGDPKARQFKAYLYAFNKEIHQKRFRS